MASSFRRDTIVLVAMLELISAITASVVGLALIHTVWRRQPAHRALLLWAGWLSLVLSVYFWSLRFGIEFGSVFGLCFISLIAWLVVSMETEQRPRRERQHDRKSPRWPNIAVIGRQSAVFLLVLFVGGIASVLLTMGLSRLLPTDEITRMAFVIIALPVVWGALAYLVTFSMQLPRSLIMLAAASAGGYGLMMI